MSVTKTLSLAQEYYVGYKLLSLIATPYEEFEAFKLGMIDDRGKTLRKSRTKEEKDAMSPIVLLAINFKQTAVFNPVFYSKLKVHPMLAMRESMGQLDQDLENEFIEAMVAGDAGGSAVDAAAGVTTGAVVNVMAADNVPADEKGIKRKKPKAVLDDNKDQE